MYECVLSLDGEVGARLVEVAQHRGEYLAEAFYAVAGVGDEQARVPEEFAAVHEHLREAALRLLRERLYTVQVGADRLSHLYVSVARFGACGLHSHGEQTVVRRHEVESVVDVACESLLVEYGLVGRGDYDIGVGVDSCDAVCGPCGAGGGVAVYGFGEHIVLAELWQLFRHDVGVSHVGDDKDVLLRHYLGKAVVGLLQLCAPRAEEVDELFRILLAAARPQPAPLASGKNHAKVICLVCHWHAVFS